MDDAAQTPQKWLGSTRSSRHQALRLTRSVPFRRRIEDDPFRVPACRRRATFFGILHFEQVPGERPFLIPVSFYYILSRHAVFLLKLFRKIFQTLVCDQFDQSHNLRIRKFHKLWDWSNFSRIRFCPKQSFKTMRVDII